MGVFMFDKFYMRLTIYNLLIMSSYKRGALIVFEGCDRSGKSTQCRKLVEKLLELGYTAQSLAFPDRSTATGRIINDYLAKKEDLSDQAIHLLFSANRWEAEPKMKRLLTQGVTLVVDRYSYSGVAYSAAKTGIDFEWCKTPENGLLKPDAVLFLNLNEESAKKRSGFGDERYEKTEFQEAVYKNYKKLEDDSWKIIDADKDIEVLHEELVHCALDTIKTAESAELNTLW